jgi:hypothetical protein
MALAQVTWDLYPMKVPFWTSILMLISTRKEPISSLEISQDGITMS